MPLGKEPNVKNHLLHHQYNDQYHQVFKSSTQKQTRDVSGEKCSNTYSYSPIEKQELWGDQFLAQKALTERKSVTETFQLKLEVN